MRPIQKLICGCCGKYTHGRQWWNQDIGYGLCSECEPFLKSGSRPLSDEEIKFAYGRKGVHWGIKKEEAK